MEKRRDTRERVSLRFRCAAGRSADLVTAAPCHLPRQREASVMRFFFFCFF